LCHPVRVQWNSQPNETTAETVSDAENAARERQRLNEVDEDEYEVRKHSGVEHIFGPGIGSPSATDIVLLLVVVFVFVLGVVIVRFSRY